MKMALELYLNESAWSSSLVKYNKKQPKGHGSTSEEMQPDHAIRSSIAIIKLPLGRDIQNNKKKCDILKKNSSEFFNFQAYL